MNRGLQLAALLMVLWTPFAMATGWTMTRDDSRLEFVATYQGQAVKGEFRRFDVNLSFDPDAPATGKLEVSVSLASADMGSADINTAIRGEEWFAVARGPEARFSSADIVAQNGDHFLAEGNLRLKGVERPIAVPFTWSTVGNGARMQGQLVLKRADFGIGTGEWASTDTIGPDVVVHFSVALKRRN